MASINRQTRSDFQFCIRNANNSQSLGVHTHFCGRCKLYKLWCIIYPYCFQTMSDLELGDCLPLSKGGIYFRPVFDQMDI